MKMKKETKDVIQYIFAGIIMTLLFALVALLIFKNIPSENKDVLNIGIGVVFGWGSLIVSYFFGSSKGSADKNELINKQETK